MLNCMRCSLKRKQFWFDILRFMSHNSNDINSKAHEKGPRFYSSAEEQEEMRLREALSRTGEERFYFLMQLMKLQQTLKKGVMEHKNE
jgi:hypothetical protein